MKRPMLTKQLDQATFLQFYYLKKELVSFCRHNGLPVSGSKAELTSRIATYLATRKLLPKTSAKKRRSSCEDIELSLDSVIGTDVVCSEKHRAFFQEHIGASFTFRVAFQKWLKTHPQETYAQAIQAYHQLMQETKKTDIDPQFEYNTYIRDFFADNKGKTLAQAILCWKYKKSQAGHHRYEREDLIALSTL